MANIRPEADLATMRQVQQQGLMARRMTGCLQQTQSAVIEEIEISVDLHHVDFPNIGEIVLTVYRPRPGIGPHRIPDLVALNDMNSFGEIRHSPRMIEVKVRIDDVADVIGLETKLFELLVNCVLASEPLRAKRIPYSRPPIFFSFFRIRNNVVDAGVPENKAMLRVFDDAIVVGIDTVSGANATILLFPPARPPSTTVSRNPLIVASFPIG